jgi:hypothetical protein
VDLTKLTQAAADGTRAAMFFVGGWLAALVCRGKVHSVTHCGAGIDVSPPINKETSYVHAKVCDGDLGVNVSGNFGGDRSAFDTMLVWQQLV